MESPAGGSGVSTAAGLFQRRITIFSPRILRMLEKKLNITKKMNFESTSVKETIITNVENTSTEEQPTEPLHEPQLKIKRWSSEEDDLLKEGVELYGRRNWKLIAIHVKTRDPGQCLQRWVKSLRPGIVKGRWQQYEDDILFSLVNEYTVEHVNWKEVTECIPGRTSKQCRERWFNYLDPKLKPARAEWTEEEDVRLCELINVHGHKWSLVARLLNSGRTENTVKVRYTAIVREFKDVPEEDLSEQVKKRPKRSHGRVSTARSFISSTFLPSSPPALPPAVTTPFTLGIPLSMPVAPPVVLPSMEEQMREQFQWMHAQMIQFQQMQQMNMQLQLSFYQTQQMQHWKTVMDQIQAQQEEELNQKYVVGQK